jgi:hypothetical protein
MKRFKIILPVILILLATLVCYYRLIISIDWLAIEWRAAPTKSELNFNLRTK